MPMVVFVIDDELDNVEQSVGFMSCNMQRFQMSCYTFPRAPASLW